MGRHYFNKKITTEDCHSISTIFLKKYDYLKPFNWRRGGIQWFFNGKETGKVNFDVDTIKKYIRFYYKTKNRYSGEDWKNKDYTIQFVTTRCYLGGERYWFVCKFCLKKVGKLFIYSDNDFACRSCLNLTYESRNYSKKFRWMGKFFKHEEIESEIRKLRTKSYKGKPTRRYRQYLKQMQKLSLTTPENQMQSFFV